MSKISLGKASLSKIQLNKTPLNKIQSFLPVFLLTIFVDQTTKFVASLWGVQMSYNSGVSFSAFSSGNLQFLTLMLAILIYLLFTGLKQFWQKNPVAAGLFFGGAVANLFDRFFFNAVRDWLHVPFTQVQNNLADWAIFAGLFLVLYAIIVEKPGNH